MTRVRWPGQHGRTVRPYTLSCTVRSVNMHCYSRLILAQGKDKTSRMNGHMEALDRPEAHEHFMRRS